MQKFIVTITEKKFDLINAPEAECFFLPSSLPVEFIKEFAAKAREAQKLTLTNDKEICSTATDGLILDLSKSENIVKDYALAVKELKHKFIGAICRNRRHEAMLVSECEPDFIIFRAWNDGAEKIKELTEWYTEFFLIQSALLPMEENLDYTAFKTDFVMINDIKFKNFVAK